MLGYGNISGVCAEYPNHTVAYLPMEHLSSFLISFFFSFFLLLIPVGARARLWCGSVLVYPARKEVGCCFELPTFSCKVVWSVGCWFFCLVYLRSLLVRTATSVSWLLSVSQSVSQCLVLLSSSIHKAEYRSRPCVALLFQ